MLLKGSTIGRSPEFAGLEQFSRHNQATPPLQGTRNLKEGGRHKPFRGQIILSFIFIADASTAPEVAVLLEIFSFTLSGKAQPAPLWTGGLKNLPGKSGENH